MEFHEFPKLARLSREIVITEKIDGTNAQIEIIQSAAPIEGALAEFADPLTADSFYLFAGSRTRYLSASADNFGFAAWATAHASELLELGVGRHYGEWWGQGVQRGYGLTTKRFSLFNVARWHQNGATPYVLQGADPRQPPKYSTEAPACCRVVPVLYRGPFDSHTIDNVLDDLRDQGSVAAPGFMKPEGVVVFHTAAGTMFKKTIEKDSEPKSKAVA